MFLVLCFSLLFQPEWSFVEVSEAAGLNFSHQYNGADEPRFIHGGVAAGDYDNDGDVDLYLVSGDVGTNALYRNNGDGTFTDVAAAAGVALSGRFDNAPFFGDYDADGHLDLFVGGINEDPPILFKNNGDGTFTDATAAAGLVTNLDSYSMALSDIDRDGDLDLFMSHWRRNYGDYMWRNNGDGTFTVVDQQAGIDLADLQSATFTPNFADINGDLWPDLLMCSDFGRSQYYHNNRQGGFVNRTDFVISDENGMGATIGDYDNDGDFDWFVSSISLPIEGEVNGDPTGNRLYRNNGQGIFEDATEASGTRVGYWGWAASFADFNLDGWEDIIHLNGFYGDFAAPYNNDTTRLFMSDGNGVSFTEQATEKGIAWADQGRGLVVFDYDNDGDLDVLTANNNQPVRLFRNDGANSQGWLRVKLDGPAGNRQGIGAVVKIWIGEQQQQRVIRAGSNFLSQDPSYAHFGLADNASVDRMEITWPDGTLTSSTNITANQAISMSHPRKDTLAVQGHRWIPHVTAASGSFATQLLLKNLGSDTAIVELQAYDANGTYLESNTQTLSGGVLQQDIATVFFPDQPVSHIRVVAPESVNVTAGYRVAEGEATTAHTSNTRKSGTTFYFHPGNWDLVFDAMAIINVSGQPVDIQARWVDSEGVEGEPVTVSGSLGDQAKSLFVFENSMTFQDNAMIKLTASGAIMPLLLRITKTGITPAQMYQVNFIEAP